MRIGVDIGSSHADLAAVDHGQVVATVKVAVTGGSNGESTALRAGLAKLLPSCPGPVDAVVVVTAQLQGALRGGHELAPTAVLRLSRPCEKALAPAAGWPARLREAAGEHVAVLPGGHDLSGQALARLDRAAVRQFAQRAARAGVRGLAVSAAASPVTADHELTAADIITSTTPELAVVLSHEFGGLGIRERENVATLNATLQPLAGQLVDTYQAVLDDLGVRAPLLYGRNDAALMNGEYLRRFPVATFDAGPASVLRGGYLLTGLDGALVCDIGATSARAGIVEGGFARRAPEASQVCGVRLVLSRPELLTAPLGGHVPIDPATGELVTAGQLTRPPTASGSASTLMDAAAAWGLCAADDHLPARAPSGSTSRQALHAAAGDLSGLNRRLQDAPRQRPFIAAGGAAALALALRDPALAGDHTREVTVRVPEHAEVAGAVGAAVAEPAAQVEHLVIARGQAELHSALDAAGEEALARVISAGADPSLSRVEAAWHDPVSYLPGSVRRVRARAVASLGDGWEGSLTGQDAQEGSEP